MRRCGSSGGERPSPLILSQQDGGAEGSLIRVTPVRAVSSPDKAGTGQYCQMVWVRRAGRRGVREEPACDIPLIRHRLEPGGCGPGAVRISSSVWAGNSGDGRHEPSWRPRGRSAAYSWRCRRGIVGLLLRRANHSEHGNRPGSCPLRRVRRCWWGWARRPSIGPGRGGAAVVLRGRESRPHGEGRQRIREGKEAAMPKDAPPN